MPGTIRKRGDSWQALLSYRDPATGRQIQRSATRSTKREAEIALGELLVWRQKAKRPNDGTQTFNELVDVWLEFKQRTAQPSSLMRYDSALRVHLRPTFGAMKVRSITAARIDARNCGAVSQVRRARRRLTRLRLSHRCGLVRYNAMTLISTPAPFATRSNIGEVVVTASVASSTSAVATASRASKLAGPNVDSAVITGTMLRGSTVVIVEGRSLMSARTLVCSYSGN